MPFDFQKYDEKCRGLTPEELQREWQHYTRLITGAATSTTVSGLAIPLTAGVSTIGVALAAPTIHNARKKREIIERHLIRHSASHVTRKRDVLGGVAVSGTIGVMTLGVASIGADAIAAQGAEHGISAIVENDTAIKVVTHAALDGAGLAVEHAHTNHVRRKEAQKSFQAAGVFEAVQDAKAAEAGYPVQPYNAQEWAAGPSSRLSIASPPPAYSSGVLSGSASLNMSLPSYNQPVTQFHAQTDSKAGPWKDQYQAEAESAAQREMPHQQPAASHANSPSIFDMNDVSRSLPGYDADHDQKAAATQQGGRCTSPSTTATQVSALSESSVASYSVFSVELPAEPVQSSASSPPRAHSTTPQPFLSPQMQVHIPTYSPLSIQHPQPQAQSQTPAASTATENTGFPPPPAPLEAQQHHPPHSQSPPMTPPELVQSHEHSYAVSSATTPAQTSPPTPHRLSIVQNMPSYNPPTQYVPTPQPAPYIHPPQQSTALPSMPYFAPPPSMPQTPAPTKSRSVARPLSQLYHRTLQKVASPPMSPPSAPMQHAPGPDTQPYQPVPVEPTYDAVSIPQSYHDKRPLSQVFPPTPMSFLNSPVPVQQQQHYSGASYFPRTASTPQPGYPSQPQHPPPGPAAHQAQYAPPVTDAQWQGYQR